MKKWILPLGLIVTAVVISISVYGRMPDQIPIHWNAYGEPDNYASKPIALFLLPAFMLVTLLIVKLIPIIDPRRENLKKNIKDIDTVNFFIILTLFAIHVVTIIYNLDHEIDMTIVPSLIGGALFLIIGNYMPRFKHNYMIGLRTPWTLADENVWRKSQLVGGRIMFLAGLIMIFSGFLPLPWMFIVFFGTVVVSTAIAVLASYLIYKKEHPNS